jgi:putative FmdB family regulatory protein
VPIYEYQCDKCGEVFEVFQKLSDPPPKSHSCGSRKVHRIMSRTSFILKGTGWYLTDYARKGTPTDSDGGGKTKKKPKDSEGSKGTKGSGSGSGSNSGAGSGTKVSSTTQAAA